MLVGKSVGEGYSLRFAVLAFDLVVYSRVQCTASGVGWVWTGHNTKAVPFVVWF